MKKKKNKNLTSLADHIEQQYGVHGTPERERFEEGFEAFWVFKMVVPLLSYWPYRQPNVMFKVLSLNGPGLDKVFIIFAG